MAINNDGKGTDSTLDEEGKTGGNPTPLTPEEIAAADKKARDAAEFARRDAAGEVWYQGVKLGQGDTLEAKKARDAAAFASRDAAATGTPTTTTTTGADPYAVDLKYTKASDYFDPSTSTTAGQMKGLLSTADGDSMVQREKSKALQLMNARGGLNSTMADTATVDAMMGYLTPIAQADAGVYQALGRMDAEYDIKSDFTAVQQSFDKMALDKNLSLDERQMMTSAFANMFSTNMTNVTRIMSDEKLDAAGKDAAIERLYKGFHDWTRTLSDLNGYDFELEF